MQVQRIITNIFPVHPAFYAGVFTGLAICALAIAFMS
jgi:hypothetical protein